MPLLEMLVKSKTDQGEVYNARNDITEWSQRANWFNVTFTLIVPLFGLISTTVVPLRKATAILAILYYFNTALGITAGMSKDVQSHPR